MSALNSIEYAINHFDRSDLNNAEFCTYLTVVKLTLDETQPKPSAAVIARKSKLSSKVVSDALLVLVERKYINEVVPIYGDGTSYSVGSVGGTVKKHLLKTLKDII